jgi:hypothetical protein
MSERKHYQHYTDDIPPDLLSAIQDSRCVVLVGAGVSRRSLSKARVPLPGWVTLLEDLCEWSLQNAKLDARAANELKQLLERREFLMVAQELLERLGGEVIGSFISDVFDPDSIVPARIHELIAAMPFRGYLTTNYDNLLERAYVHVRNRQIDWACSEEVKRMAMLIQKSSFLLKLHGDLSTPESIVLAHRDYARLLSDQKYLGVLTDLLSTYSVLMLGYSLSDLDLLFCIDRLVQKGRSRRHYLLSQRGRRNQIERSRLLKDRNIQVIEYIDNFGFHNHVETFLDAIVDDLSLPDVKARVRRELRRRIHVHYLAHRTADGEFVWNYIFREGAITLSAGAQPKQLDSLRAGVSEGLVALDYLVFLVDEASLTNDEFAQLVERAELDAESRGVQLVFLVIGEHRRLEFLQSKFASSPTFYLPEGFGEKHLQGFREYISEDMKGGFRQP